MTPREAIAKIRQRIAESLTDEDTYAEARGRIYLYVPALLDVAEAALAHLNTSDCPHTASMVHYLYELAAAVEGRG
jgi:hypothetical protein